MVDVAVAPGTQEARAALEAVVPRLTALIRSIKRPTAPAVGVWNVGDVAVHVAHAWERLSALAGDEATSPIDDVWQLADFTTSLVQGDPERDMHAVAGRIDAAAAKFLDMLGTSSGDDLSPWLIAGIKVPIQMFACHLLNESLVHGFDIARAERITWPIDPSHAGVVLMGFIFPVVAKLDPRAMVDQEKAAGVRACYDIRVRRAGRVFLIFDDGSVSIEPPSSRPVDCHMSADATALLLVMWARKSQWPAVLTAQIITWGRKPWLGAKLRTMIRNP